MTDPSIGQVFAGRRAEGRAALIPYVTGGYPRPDVTVELMQALADEGADIIELGIPFSDPLADGPTIQQSSFVSLAGGTTVESVLSDLRAYRSVGNAPVVLFTYLNPILRFGLDAFLGSAVDSGASGLLITDLPAGADPDLEDRIRASGLDLIRLVAPTTPPERVPRIADTGSGFLYYISRTGVTGARAVLRDDLAEEVERLRAAQSLPVAVGFGISTPDQARTVADVADGVVVGSALIQTLSAEGMRGAADFIASLRQGMDAG
jgi:tryptophan synthase alpha chain